ncbi:MAG: type IV pilus biogenesis protein EbsA [Cyanobacteria bacterium P01_D01_bin.73]
MSLDKLEPAAKGAVGVYIPYYQGTKRSILPFAIGLYQKGKLEGKRSVEGGESIPFVAAWSVSTLPSDLTRCRVQFNGEADFSYEIMMPNFEFIGCLIDMLIHFKKSRRTDFSKTFYRKLLNFEA